MEFSFQQITGKVVKKEIKRGKVNTILTERGEEFIIRQDGKTAFENSELDQLEGKVITAIGTLQSHVLVVNSFEENPIKV